VLDIQGNNPAQGTPIIVWPRKSSGTQNQQWDLSSVDFIQSHLNNFVLDIKGGVPTPGTQIIAWPRKSSGTQNQQWRLAW
jgi:hypothetical protein